jgi:hypothetical protein
VTTIVRAEGAGSIAVGRDAINSIFVTGGVNQFFVGDYERLADAYLNPQTLYRELQLDEYVGRAWLAAAIDGFLTTHDRGYLVIEAEAGMGKTAFLAWLARQRNYVHHFVRLMPDPDDVGTALRSMAAQLIRAWDLQDRAVGGVLPPTASRPAFFEDLLHAAAAKRDESKPGEPIVLTVDGLNETTPRPGQNPLALPPDVPPGVYMIVTQRTVHVPMWIAAPRQVLQLRAGNEENLADMRAYLRAVAAKPDLAARIAAASITPDEFVDRLVDRTKGVWLVLRYVLAELRNGVRAADDVGSLPLGLWQYYAQFWHAWQRDHGEQWADVDLPLLMAITACQEPATVEFLCELGGVTDVDRAEVLVGDQWRPFLEVVEDEKGERYAPFHDSLVEFVAGDVDVDSLASAERSLVRRLADGHRATHARIARRYLDGWGGMDVGLPALRAGGAGLPALSAGGGAAGVDDGYGMRHVVAHLAHAGDDETLHRFMALEWDGRINVWFDVHWRLRAFGAYATDVRRAWARSQDVARDFRYALMASSVNSVAGSISPVVLRQLVEGGHLAPEQGLALAREVPDVRARAEALTGLASVVTGAARDEALRDALASVQAVPDGYWRAGELARLIPVLGAEYGDDVRRIVDTMRYKGDRDVLLWMHGQQSGDRSEPPLRTDPTAPDPVNFLSEYRGRTNQAVATLMLAGRLDASFVADLLASPTAALGAAVDGSAALGDRPGADAAMASIATLVASRGRWSDAVDIVTTIDAPAALADGLFALARVAPEAEQKAVVALGVDAISAIPEVSRRAGIVIANAALLGDIDVTGWPRPWRERVLARLGQASADDPTEHEELAVADVPTWRAAARLRAGDIGGAFDIADGEADAATRAAVLLRLPASWEGRDPLREASDLIATVDEPDVRTRLNTALAVALSEADRFGECLAVVEDLPDDGARLAALEQMAPYAHGDDLTRAIAAAESLADEPARARVLARLTPALDRSHVRHVLHLLGEGTREDLLRAVPDLLRGVGSTDALVDMAASIVSVERWWP